MVDLVTWEHSGVLNRIRRSLGLHVHNWEAVADETFEVRGKPVSGGRNATAQAQNFVGPGWRPWDIVPSPPMTDLMTFKCRSCGLVRTSRVRVG